MRKLLAVGLGIVLAGTVVTAQNPTRVYTEPPLPSPEALNRLNLVLAWRAYLPTDARRDGIFSVQIVDQPKGAGQQVFVQTRSCRLIALDAATGTTLWRNQVGTPYAAKYPVGYNSSTVFVVNAGELYAVSRSTGEVLWGFSLPHAPTAAPVADEERVYVTVGTGRLVAYRIPPLQAPAPAAPPPAPPRQEPVPEPVPRTIAEATRLPTSAFGVSGQARSAISAVSSRGETVRSIGPLSSAGQAARAAVVVGAQPVQVWDFLATTRLDIAPLLTGEFILVAGYNGEFYALSKFDGRTLYVYPAGPPLTAPIGQYGETAYVASQDFNVYALDIVPGRILWRFLGGGPIIRKPAVNDDSVYVTPERAGLYRLERTTGRILWRNARAERFLAANRKFAYAVDNSGRLLILDRARGTDLTVYDGAIDYVVPVTNEITDRLFLASNNGLLVCLHDRDYPTPLRLKAVQEVAAESPPRRAGSR